MISVVRSNRIHGSVEWKNEDSKKEGYDECPWGQPAAFQLEASASGGIKIRLGILGMRADHWGSQ